LAAAGVARDEVADCQELDGGTFNTVFRVTRADGSRLVVKLAPDPAVPVLRYERGILDTEAWFYTRVRAATRVPVPEALVPGPDDRAAADGHLVMSECPGTPWSELAGSMDADARTRLRSALGGHVAELHTITGDAGFGYPAHSLGPLRTHWRTAFLGMVDAVLDDARRFGVPLPRPAQDVRALFAAQSDADLAAALSEQYVRKRRQLAVDRLARAQELGQIRGDVDLETIVDQLWGACYHRLLMPAVPLDTEFADRLVGNLFTGVARG
jgi:hypothetical protein